MFDRYGVILLDLDEVLISIYEKTSEGVWKLLQHTSYDLATFTKGRHPEASEIIEIIAQTTLSNYAIHVIEWRICARGLEEEVLHKISIATNIHTELLNLHREQELLSKGILIECDEASPVISN